MPEETPSMQNSIRGSGLKNGDIVKRAVWFLFGIMFSLIAGSYGYTFATVRAEENKYSTKTELQVQMEIHQQTNTQQSEALDAMKESILRELDGVRERQDSMDRKLDRLIERIPPEGVDT